MNLVCPAPLSEDLQDVRRVTVDLGEAPVDVAGVEMRRMHSVGEEFAGGLESQVE